jgi:hypothetical protein
MDSFSRAAACSRVACATRRAQLAPGENWSLVTAPDEQERCCFVLRGERCGHITAHRVSGKDRALDDYTYVCECHLGIVRGPDDLATDVDVDAHPRRFPG